MDHERDHVRTPWGWLSGLAWFLLAWPLLSLLALDQLDLAEWDSILAAMLGPAAVGLVLLGVERLLTRTFGAAAAAARQPRPSTLRDLSNVGLCLAILLGANVALVSVFEDESLFAREGSNAGPIAGYLLGACFGAAVVFRLLHRWIHGPARKLDMGEGWDAAPNVMRLFGYLTLIPTLFVCTVMIDYTLRERPDFGVTAWVVLPGVLLLGLRSAMARSPRYWAKSPWEAWLRQESLALPWWVVGLVLGVATSVLFVATPFAMGADEITLAGRIIVGVLLGPIGLFMLYVVGKGLAHGLPLLLRRWRVARCLARDPGALLGWSARRHGDAKTGIRHDVALRLRDGRKVSFDADGDAPPLVRWLEQHAAEQRVVVAS